MFLWIYYKFAVWNEIMKILFNRIYPNQSHLPRPYTSYFRTAILSWHPQSQYTFATNSLGFHIVIPVSRK